MAQIRTQFQEHTRVHANPGSREKILYSPQFNDDGTMELIEAGKENLYEYIQSHKESVDINVILKRFARGDVTALQRRQAMFGDFSDAPSSYAEALNSMIVAEQYFNSLPLETRAKFDHNFHRFLVSLDRPDFQQMLSPDDVQPDAVATRQDANTAEPSAAAVETTPETPST